MTQSPQTGGSAPVDTAAGTDRVASAPLAGSVLGAGSHEPTAHGVPAAHGAPGGAGVVPRPDTPTDSVPVVNDGPDRGAATGQAATSAPRQSAPAGGNRRARARGPRRAQLQLRHINPWTVLKFSCVLAVALFFVWLIVVGVLYGILDGAGVIGRINDAYTTLKGDGSGAPVTAGVVFGGAAIIGVVNIILFIALSTIGAVVYNLCADLVGGVEVTLSER